MNERKRVKPTIVNSHQKWQSKNKEKEAAEDMRSKSLERLFETRKREAQDRALSCSSHNEKISRSSGGDTIVYLWQMSEKDFHLR